MTIVYLLSNDPVSGPWMWSGDKHEIMPRTAGGKTLCFRIFTNWNTAR